MGMDFNDMDLIEVNEAVAVQILANESVRIIVTLYHALKRMDKEIGIASICGGTGVACSDHNTRKLKVT